MAAASGSDIHPITMRGYSNGDKFETRSQQGFASILMSEMFTFLIGPDEVKFVVHKDAVTRHSKVFDNMMNGKMKETVEKTARLPDVDHDTFANFVEFCYTSNYGTGPQPTGNLQWAVSQTMHGTSTLVSIRSKHLSLFCCACSIQFSLSDLAAGKGTFCGRCLQEHQSNGKRDKPPYPKGTFCFFCGEFLSTPDTIVCRSCLGDQQDFIGESYCSQRGLLVLSENYCAILDEEFGREYATNKRQPENPTIRTETMLDAESLIIHSRMCTFADIYDIEALQLMALIKLCQNLDNFALPSNNTAKVVEWIREVDCCTSDLHRASSPAQKSLRMVLIRFMLEHGFALITTEEGSSLIGDGGQLAIDFARAAMGAKPIWHDTVEQSM